MTSKLRQSVKVNLRSTESKVALKTLARLQKQKSMIKNEETKQGLDMEAN